MFSAERISGYDVVVAHELAYLAEFDAGMLGLYSARSYVLRGFVQEIQKPVVFQENRCLPSAQVAPVLRYRGLRGIQQIGYLSLREAVVFDELLRDERAEARKHFAYHVFAKRFHYQNLQETFGGLIN